MRQASNISPPDALPSIMVDDVAVRVLIGEAFGAVRRSRRRATRSTGYPAAGRWLRDLPASYPERAVWRGPPLQIDGEALAEHSLGVLAGVKKCASALEKRRGW